jgi:hypothetical protein
MSIQKFSKVKLKLEIIDDNHDAITSRIITLDDIALEHMFNPNFIKETYQKLLEEAKNKLISTEEELEIAIGAINVKELKLAEDKNLFLIEHVKKYINLDVTSECVLDLENNVFSGTVIFGEDKVYTFTHTF